MTCDRTVTAANNRTTGIERPGDKTSPFVLVHDAERIRAAKRLHMTATPRLCTESTKAKAVSHSVDVFSMGDEATYGPEFHRLPFARAVEQKPAAFDASSRGGILEALQRSPLVGANIDFTRPYEEGREVVL